MPKTLDGQLTIEKTPSYFVTREAPSRLHRLSHVIGNDIRIILVVRDPVTRAISDYTQVMSKRVDTPEFADLAFVKNSSDMKVNVSWGAIRIGLYAKHLQRWLNYFPMRLIHVVNGERLISDPAGELAKLQDFLGLKRLVTDKHFYFNTTKGFPCLKKGEGTGKPRCLGNTKGRRHPFINDTVIQRLRQFYRPYNHKFYRITGIDFNWP